jgi:hypothetical protein
MSKIDLYAPGTVPLRVYQANVRLHDPAPALAPSAINEVNVLVPPVADIRFVLIFPVDPPDILYFNAILKFIINY